MLLVRPKPAQGAQRTDRRPTPKDLLHRLARRSDAAEALVMLLTLDMTRYDTVAPLENAAIYSTINWTCDAAAARPERADFARKMLLSMTEVLAAHRESHRNVKACPSASTTVFGGSREYGCVRRPFRPSHSHSSTSPLKEKERFSPFPFPLSFETLTCGNATGADRGGRVCRRDSLMRCRCR